MNKRKVSVIAGMAIFIVAGVVAWFLMTGNVEEADREAPIEVIRVPTVEANLGQVTNLIRFTGRVVPENRFDIFAEVTGRLQSSSKPFKTGTSFNKGEPIVVLNDDEQRQQLEAARYEFSALISQVLPDLNIDYPNAFDEWRQYLENFDSTQLLPTLPEVEDEQLRLFLNGRNIYSRFAGIKQQEVRLEKYTIRAPFNGVVTESRADPGALVQPNQRLGEFTKLSPLEIAASIPARQAQYIEVGDRLQIMLNRESIGSINARIDRKNAKIDAENQSVQFFMKVSDTKLQPGMYVEGSIAGNNFDDAIKIHQDALVRESEIFVINDSLASMRQVRVLNQAGDSVTISGLNPGEMIIDDFRNASFEGTKVAPLEDQ